MLVIKIKNMSDEDRGRKKEYMRTYYYKIKNLLNNLVNRIEGLENASLKK